MKTTMLVPFLASACLLAACGDDGGEGAGGGGGGGGEGGATSSSSARPSEAICNDGDDDDVDGLVDCLDDDCAGACADSCGNARDIALGDELQASNEEAGDEIDGSCVTRRGDDGVAGTGGPERVFAFTAEEAGLVVFDLVSVDDLALSVRGACAQSSSELGCADGEAGAGTERLTLFVESGETYFVVVEGRDPGDVGEFQLQVALSETSCGQAEPLALGDTVDGNNLGGFSEIVSCGFETRAPERVYRVVADQDGVLTVTLTPESTFDADLSIRTACQEAEGEVCAVKATGQEEVVTVPVQEGDVRYLVVDGYSSEVQGQDGPVGTYTIRAEVRAVECGDGIVDPGEPCDDGDADLGCSDACTIEVCDAPTALADGGSVAGDLATASPALVPGSCLPAGLHRERVYAITAAQTGKLDVTLASPSGSVGVQLRSSCDIGGDLGCSASPNGVRSLTIDATDGETYLVVVRGSAALDDSSYVLDAATRQPSCGDGFVDQGEACDDGGEDTGDGCGASCAAEGVSCAEPLPLSPGATGTFSAGGNGNILTLTCGFGQLDTVFAVVADQTGVLEARIDRDAAVAIRSTCAASADEVCASGGSPRAAALVQQGETYYVVASPVSAGPFELSVETRPLVCGDGEVDPGEECDDNLVDGDGCTDCTIDVDETEQNGVPATADAYEADLLATIRPAGDIDFFTVVVAQAGSTVTAAVTAGPYSVCGPPGGAGYIDSVVSLLAPDGVTVLASNDDFAGSYCSTVSVPGLAAGTYFVRVSATGITPTFDYGLDVVVD